MEFLRFGSSIPGTYWGCCACCIIQNFNVDPDAKASIQIVEGDGGTVQTIYKDGKYSAAFAGPTYRDIFWQRLRYGTFSLSDMPNHAFLAIITANQISGIYGSKWLALLKEAGFEFIRTINNSVYNGDNLLTEKSTLSEHGSSANYLFGLFRNIGSGAAKNPFLPPKAWLDMDNGIAEAVESVSEHAEKLAEQQRAFHRKVWDKLPEQQFLTEEELEKDGVPIWLAGQRSANPQRMKPKAPAGAAQKVSTEDAQKVASEGLAPFKPF